MIYIVTLVTAVLGLVSMAVRALEGIYQLSQKPGLNTFQKCWQVIKNFFTVETYKKT